MTLYGYKLEKVQTKFVMGDEYAKLALAVYSGEKSTYQGEDYVSWTQLFHIVWQTSSQHDDFYWYGMKVENTHTSNAHDFDKTVKALSRINKAEKFGFSQQPDDFVEWLDNRSTHRLYWDDSKGQLVQEKDAEWSEMTVTDWVAEPTWTSQ